MSRRKSPANSTLVAPPNGASFDDIVASVVESAAALGAPPEDGPVLDVREGMRWAQDVFFAYSKLGERLTKATAGSAARYALWRHANKDMDQFIGVTLPRAMAILDRAQAKTGDTGLMEAHEKKGIAELEKILRAAIHEAVGE